MILLAVSQAEESQSCRWQCKVTLKGMYHLSCPAAAFTALEAGSSLGEKVRAGCPLAGSLLCLHDSSPVRFRSSNISTTAVQVCMYVRCTIVVFNSSTACSKTSESVRYIVAHCLPFLRSRGRLNKYCFHELIDSPRRTRYDNPYTRRCGYSPPPSVCNRNVNNITVVVGNSPIKNLRAYRCYVV